MDIVVDEDHKVIAFALYLVGSDQIHLLKIAVKVSARKQGLGLCLLDDKYENIDPMVTSCYLEVEAQNSKAIGLYTKNGFEIVHRAERYYSDGSDAIKMISIR